MSQVKLGIDIQRDANLKKQSVEDSYKQYNPRVSDLAYYFYNVFLDSGDAKKYAPLIGEQENAISALVAFTMGDAPIIIRSWAGTGKTVISNTVWSILPDHLKYEVEMGSNLALWYQARKINDHRFIFFNEFQNSADSKEVEKVLKLWGEGRSAHRQVSDMVESAREGEDVTRDQVLGCKPFFTTLAVENKGGAAIWNDEFGRRMIDLYTDVSETQTKRVVDYMLQVYERGVKNMATMTDEKKTLLKYHIDQAILLRDELITEYRFPAASKIADQIPTKFVQARSAIPLLMRMMNAFAVFNYKNRIVTDEGVMLITPEDLFLTWCCYGKRFAQKCFNMDMLADELLQVFPICKTPASPRPDELLNSVEIKSRLKTMKINIPQRKLKMLLDSFTDGGILDTIRDPDRPDEVLYFNIGIADFEATFNYREIIEHCKKSVQENHPKYAKEYIRRFCDNVVVEHPFKPHEVNLVTGETRIINRGWSIPEELL